ncbi:hypothetical protein Mapa_015187 [Marchantia paleacea]|nr:hypothetical protein Mapa_015187 [Marchantia paleacea]
MSYAVPLKLPLSPFVFLPEPATSAEHRTTLTTTALLILPQLAPLPTLAPVHLQIACFCPANVADCCRKLLSHIASNPIATIDWMIVDPNFPFRITNSFLTSPSSNDEWRPEIPRTERAGYGLHPVSRLPSIHKGTEEGNLDSDQGRDSDS